MFSIRLISRLVLIDRSSVFTKLTQGVSVCLILVVRKEEKEVKERGEGDVYTVRSNLIRHAGEVHGSRSFTQTVCT